MTKAERLFAETRYECKTYLNNWGYKLNEDGTPISYARVGSTDDDYVCTRTLNEMMKLLEKGRKHIERCKEHGIYDDDKYEFETQLHNMIEATIRNHRKIIESI